jgi:hypothetical protein
MADSTTRVLSQYHKPRFHPHLHKPAAGTKVETLYAYQLGPLTAAVAAHGGTNKWVAAPVIPLADSDEVHMNWVTPHDCDTRYPIYIRWGLIANAAAKGGTITTTVSTVDLGATHTGSGDAGDGGTALAQTIAAIATGDNPGADKPFFTVWGKKNGATTDYDILEIKLVASAQTTADALRVFCLQIAYWPRTA